MTPSPQDPQAVNASNALNVPSLLLMLLAGLGIPFALFALLGPGNEAQIEQMRHIKGMSPQLIDMMRVMGGPVQKVMNLLGLGIDAFVIFGALQMRQLKNWPIAVAAAGASLLPLGSCCCCVSIGVGIWALTILTKPEIKAQFS